MTDIDTRFITLIGKPLSQSFAARMQNRAYEAAGFNMHYFYTEADEKHLKEIIEGIRYMPSFAGAAVTKPNKVEVLKYLDRLDPLCEKMGACNTIVREADGSLTGFNTDGAGFITSISEEAGFDPKGKRFFCIGAGGAGRAICSVLAYCGAAKIYVTSLDPKETESVVGDINDNFADCVHTEALDKGGALGAGIAEAVSFADYSVIPTCDMVINASGVGMGTTAGQDPLPKEYFCRDKLYFDACYNPDKTQFLLDAEAAGCRILNGLGMSLYQGAAQIELWTGGKAPVDAMRQELTDIIRERNEG